MTIIEIKNQILSHFYDNDVFDLDVDGGKVELSSDIESCREEIIITVLEELVSLKIIKKINSATKRVWILTQSFDSFNQNIVIGAEAAEIIADTINNFREANDISEHVSDKLNIKESDILNLVNICHSLLESGIDPLQEKE